jgi:hypothetical protein
MRGRICGMSAAGLHDQCGAVERLGFPGRRYWPHTQILPIGGPGKAAGPADQAEMLFGLLGRPPKTLKVPVILMDIAVAYYSLLGMFIASYKDAAERFRIMKYYTTESMLVWDAKTQAYDEAATPSYGTETLESFFKRTLADDTIVEGYQKDIRFQISSFLARLTG